MLIERYLDGLLPDTMYIFLMKCVYPMSRKLCPLECPLLQTMRDVYIYIYIIESRKRNNPVMFSINGAINDSFLNRHSVR